MMKIKLSIICLLSILIFSVVQTASAQKPKRGGKSDNAPAFVKTDKDELEAALALAPAERIEKLKAFIEAHPRSTLKSRAQESLVAAHAVLGEERLKAGDEAGGAEEFRQAVAAIPQPMTDKLYTEVVAQIPNNLFLRGASGVAVELARKIEEHVKDNPMRLLSLSAFYLGIESPEDALRTADLVIKLAPDAAAAYEARGAAHRIALQLEESTADYARALELSPKSDFSRRSLAELLRATGKTEEALPLYRELLKVNAADEFARVGMVISLFELGKKEEAERELDAALKDMPTSLALLSGAAYWFAAHHESARAVELAQRAVDFEPRYTWGHIALARGLLAQKRPLEAERALIVARQYGRFPTLDYELATVLAAAGLYGEAAASLTPAFTVKDDQIETLLAGRTPAHAASFTDLLAPERRASIFQFTAADNETSARTLKALLAFTSALNPTGGREAIKEAETVAAAQSFINAGDDDTRAFRRLYVASRLVEYKIALPKSLEQLDAATAEVETALSVSNASIAVMADELRGARSTANTYGSTLNVPDIPRQTLSRIMRGNMEDIAGWSLYNQDKFADAIVRLRRAISVLPEKSIWWRNAMWHLGASLEASGKPQDALDAYFKSYNSNSRPDTSRYAVIQALYRRVNGKLDGLEDKIGPSPVLVANANTDTATANTTTPNSFSDAANSSTPASVTGNEANRTEEAKPAETKPAEARPTETKPVEAKPVEALPKTDAVTEPKPDASKAADASKATAMPTPSTTPASEAASPPKVETPPSQTPAPTPEPSPTASPAEVPPGPAQPADNDEPPSSPSPTPSTTQAAPPAASSSSSNTSQRPRRVGEASCNISLSENEMTINSGGSANIMLTLDGAISADKVTASSSDWSAIAA
ncbi:MAG TPA: tetratricopeptide repeat protein, partial [Pyrinomonadaceae bacterium]